MIKVDWLRVCNCREVCGALVDSGVQMVAPSVDTVEILVWDPAMADPVQEVLNIEDKQERCKVLSSINHKPNLDFKNTGLFNHNFVPFLHSDFNL